MPKPNNSTLKYRVGELEKDYDVIAKDIKKILVNHLPHLSSDIASLKTEVRVWAVVNAGSIIVGIIIAKMFL